MTDPLSLAAALLAAHPEADVAPADLAPLFQTLAPFALRPGEALCAEDDPGSALFVLAEGTVRVTKNDLGGTPRVVNEVAGPTLLGHVGVIERARRSATVHALTDCRGGVVDLAGFQHWMRDIGPTGRALRRLLLASLTRQLVRGNEHLRGLVAARAQPSGSAFLRASGIVEGWTDEATASAADPAGSMGRRA